MRSMFKEKRILASILGAGFFLAACQGETVIIEEADDTTIKSYEAVRIVGSSTVYPFSTTVAEQFGAKTVFPTPIVESTGSGGGMKLFCGGIGAEFPDISNASRRMKASEYDLCQSNGVTDIIEVKIGYDGIVIVNAKTGVAPEFSFTKKQLFEALAKEVPDGGVLKENTTRRWSDISAELPATPIQVFGPPPTSGTRDAFVELAMEGGAKKFPMLSDLRSENKSAFKAVSHAIREDSAWIDSGENDNAIVQSLIKNEQAIGVFGFSFLDENRDRLRAAPIDGVEPTFEAISSGEYSISRSLYFYIKKAHIEQKPGIIEFAEEFVAESSWGPEGYLVEKGLIPLPETERASVAENVLSRHVMERPD